MYLINRFAVWSFALALVFGISAKASAQLAANDPIQVQTRGPIHEAFAQPYDAQPQASIAVPQAPPVPIAEVPPQDRPEGGDVQWIGGYWAWDADQNTYIWISGTYRNTPPGQRYVSGYWQQDTDGWHWVSGFWAPQATQEIPYVPQPPATLDNGPHVPAPDANSIYVPGYWAYYNANWTWRPGYWQPNRPGLVCIPPQYTWTPAGYLLVPSYWDYPLENRGLLFAPVCFTQPVYLTAGWTYTPDYCVRPTALLDSLFFWPHHHHYFFGDYYGARYANLGYRPWITAGAQFRDPLYGYYRHQHRNDVGWLTGMQTLHADRVAGRAPLPPRTLAQQTTIVNNVANSTNINKTRVNSLEVVRPVTKLNDTNIRLTRVAPAQVAAHRAEADRVREVAQNRARVEQNVARPGGVATAPRTLNLAKTAARVANPAQPKVVSPPAHANTVQPKGVNPPTHTNTVNPVQSKGVNPPHVNTVQPKGANPPHVNTVQPKAVNPPNPVQPKGVNPPHMNTAQPKVPNPQPAHVNTVQPKAVTPPAHVNAAQPKAVNPPHVNTVQPKAANPLPKVAASPAPHVATPSAPRVAQPAPKAAQPKVTAAPRPAQPKAVSAPQPAPRVAQPKAAAAPRPAPARAAPAPRVAQPRAAAAPRPAAAAPRPTAPRAAPAPASRGKGKR